MIHEIDNLLIQETPLSYPKGVEPYCLGQTSLTSLTQDSAALPEVEVSFEPKEILYMYVNCEA